jgi:Ca2+-binding EF-hand superfamily protein
MYQHWRTTFEILDEDGSKEVSRTEFETLGFLFNFTPQAVRKIYQEFDVTGNSELDYKEFRLFVLAAIDMQTKLENKAKERANRPDFVHKLKMVLSDLTGVEF